ncbi:MAG: hypothetical protein ABIL02_06695 [candidate division WOR-3 bacterium]
MSDMYEEYRVEQEHKAQRAEIPIELRKRIRAMSDEEIKKEYDRISYGIKCWLEDSLFGKGSIMNFPKLSNEETIYFFTGSTKWGKFYFLNKEVKRNPEGLIKCKGKMVPIKTLYEESCIEVLIVEEYYKRFLKRKFEDKIKLYYERYRVLRDYVQRRIDSGMKRIIIPAYLAKSVSEEAIIEIERLGELNGVEIEIQE